MELAQDQKPEMSYWEIRREIMTALIGGDDETLKELQLEYPKVFDAMAKMAYNQMRRRK